VEVLPATAPERSSVWPTAIIAVAYVFFFIAVVALFIVCTTAISAAFQLDGPEWAIDAGLWVVAAVLGIAIGALVGMSARRFAWSPQLLPVAVAWAGVFFVLTGLSIVATPYLPTGGPDAPFEPTVTAVLRLVAYVSVFGVAIPVSLAVGLWLTRSTVLGGASG
jgi:hypothetical protein